MGDQVALLLSAVRLSLSLAATWRIFGREWGTKLCSFCLIVSAVRLSLSLAATWRIFDQGWGTKLRSFCLMECLLSVCLCLSLAHLFFGLRHPASEALPVPSHPIPAPFEAFPALSEALLSASEAPFEAPFLSLMVVSLKPAVQSLKIVRKQLGPREPLNMKRSAIVHTCTHTSGISRSLSLFLIRSYFERFGFYLPEHFDQLCHRQPRIDDIFH